MSANSTLAVLLLIAASAACGERESAKPAAASGAAVPKAAPHSEERIAVGDDDAPAPLPIPVEAPKVATPAPPAAPAQPTPPPAQKSRPGAVLGRVVLDGPAPEPDPIDPSTIAGCTPGDARDVRVLVDPAGGIANVVVRTTVPGFEFFAAGKVRELVHRNCRFEPRVAFVPVGTTLRFTNADPEAHAVHVFEPEGASLLESAIEPNQSVETTCAKAGLLQIRCETHPWTSSWIVVASSPFTTLTKPDGSFEILGLPAGEHVLELWHERLGKLEERVRIADDATSRVEIRWPSSSAR